MNLRLIHLIPVSLIAALVVACGGDDDDGSAARADAGSVASTPAVDPTPDADPTTPVGSDGSANTGGACDLTDPEVVASVFDATAGTEEPGVARNCTYLLEGGMTDQIDVFYYGTAAEWDGIRQGYEDNRGPLADVAGVGDEAFTPGDVGDYELVVRGGDVVFAVSYIAGAAPADYGDRLRSLAQQIIAGLQ